MKACQTGMLIYGTEEWRREKARKQRREESRKKKAEGRRQKAERRDGEQGAWVGSRE